MHDRKHAHNTNIGKNTRKKFQFIKFSMVLSHRPPAERVAWIFFAISGKKQRHGSALIGASNTV
jgi:hypothetical protein